MPFYSCFAHSLIQNGYHYSRKSPWTASQNIAAVESLGICHSFVLHCIISSFPGLPLVNPIPTKSLEGKSLIIRVFIEQFYENLEEATIGRWLKAEGDRVGDQEPLVEIITDKITFELPAPGSGVVRSIISREKSVVPVGCVIGLLGEPDDPLPDVSAENRATLERRQREVESQARIPSPETVAPEASVSERVRDRGKVRATPAARRVARENGMDLAEVAASIGGGLIQEEDVQRWIERRGSST